MKVRVTRSLGALLNDIMVIRTLGKIGNVLLESPLSPSERMRIKILFIFIFNVYIERMNTLSFVFFCIDI